jgi:signal transduction histidine kinase
MMKKLIKKTPVSVKKITRHNLEEKLKQGADREKQGADREKKGAHREKLAARKFRKQTDELKIRSGQLKQGADREKQGADREKQGAHREKQGADREKQGAAREKQGAHREKIAKEQLRQRDLEIETQREELLHVTRVGKLAEFVSSLAHEISQPLTAILSYAQAAQRMLGDREPQVREILQYIVSDDQRAAEVIRRLRSLLKKTKPTFELLDINTLIKDTVTLIMAHITVRNKVIKLKLDRSLPFIYGDRIQLQQVVLNLISNSLEAMDVSKASRELSITTLRSSNDMVMVEVTDSGCGIPEENIKKLFVHFFTNKPDGLGMGLSISRSIVEGHGGRLEAKNNPKQGATFYFTLPIHRKA